MAVAALAEVEALEGGQPVAVSRLNQLRHVTSTVLLLDTLFNIGKVILQSEAKINNVGKETTGNMLLTFGTATPARHGHPQQHLRVHRLR